MTAHFWKWIEVTMDEIRTGYTPNANWELAGYHVTRRWRVFMGMAVMKHASYYTWHALWVRPQLSPWSLHISGGESGFCRGRLALKALLTRLFSWSQQMLLFLRCKCQSEGPGFEPWLLNSYIHGYSWGINETLKTNFRRAPSDYSSLFWCNLNQVKPPYTTVLKSNFIFFRHLRLVLAIRLFFSGLQTTVVYAFGISGHLLHVHPISFKWNKKSCEGKDSLKNGVFWDVTPCGSDKNRCFGGT
jgi:hypothetical protein